MVAVAMMRTQYQQVNSVEYEATWTKKKNTSVRDGKNGIESVCYLTDKRINNNNNGSRTRSASLGGTLYHAKMLKSEIPPNVSSSVEIFAPNVNEEIKLRNGMEM